MMITFEQGDNCFNYRIVGVAVNETSVLLHRDECEDFWILPGGRAEFGESAEETLKREMREEIGVDVEVVRLLWFVENFFKYTEKNYHEITLYFLMTLPDGCKYLTQSGPYRGLEEEGGVKLVFEWFARRPEFLSTLPLLPSFLRTALEKLPESVQHVVHHDG
jgi:ADP-ribose pyrophosphatase YjhB (NUDIX family)